MARLLDIGIPTLRKIEQNILPSSLTVAVLGHICSHFGIGFADQLRCRLGEENAPVPFLRLD
ncbi:MAG: hypothetical protein IJ438_07740 [Clostridia bacterium]|nr:hypothetical protein [Clostridia bacterium]